MLPHLRITVVFAAHKAADGRRVPKRTLGPFDTIREAVHAMVEARGPGQHTGAVHCEPVRPAATREAA